MRGWPGVARFTTLIVWVRFALQFAAYRKFYYDLWGDTVNTASRMESTGEPGCIQVTPETWTRVKDRYASTRRDEVEVKGKGRMTTYLLDVAVQRRGSHAH